MKRITKIFFNKEQIGILNKCKVANKEEYSQWIYKNVLYPLVIIIVPYIFTVLIPGTEGTFRGLVFNGSISLVGINILFGMSSYLVKFSNNVDKDQNKKFNDDTVHLRDKLSSFSYILVFLGGVFYVIQALFDSYSSDLKFYVFIALIFLVLSASVFVGRSMFIIKNDFMDKAYGDEINDNVEKGNDRLREKYG